MIADNAFFSGVGAASLARALPAFRIVTLPAGTTLYRRGRTARRVFLILSGSVAVGQRTSGLRTVVALLGPGEFTGEQALLRPALRHSWSAVCRTETVVAVAEGERLHALTASSPAFGMNVARGVYRRVVDASSAIDALVAAR